MAIDVNIKTKIKLDSVAIFFRGQTIDVSRSVLLITGDENARPLEIMYIVEFEPPSAKIMAKYFDAMKEALDGIANTFAFQMTAEAMSKYSDEFTKAKTMEEWLNAGQSACLNLDNYDCLGSTKID